METLIKKTFRFFSNKVLYFVLGFLISLSIVAVNAAWNSPVGSGQQLTVTLWNDLVAKIVEINDEVTSLDSAWTLAGSNLSTDYNVGIGTAGTEAKLNIYGASSVVNVGIGFGGTPAAGAALGAFRSGYGGSGGLDRYSSVYAYNAGPLGSSNIGLKFDVWENDANRALNAVTINNTGSVGIGTDDPNAKLTVAGNFTPGSTNSQIMIIGATNPNNYLSIGYDTTNNQGRIQAKTEGTTVRELLLNPEGGNVNVGWSLTIKDANIRSVNNNYAHINIGSNAGILSYGSVTDGNALYVAENAYIDASGTWKRKSNLTTADEAGKFEMGDGQFSFERAVADAGNTDITWLPVLKTDAEGDVIVAGDVCTTAGQCLSTAGGGSIASFSDRLYKTTASLGNDDPILISALAEWGVGEIPIINLGFEQGAAPGTDMDTKIRSYARDVSESQNFITIGRGRVDISAGATYITGNVGIGRTNPFQKLDIYNGGIILQRNTPAQSIEFHEGDWSVTGTTDWKITHNTDRSLSIDGVGMNTDLLLNPSGGEVGIGIADPVTVLDVRGNGIVLRVDGGLSFGNSSTVTDTGMAIQHTDGNSTMSLTAGADFVFRPGYNEALRIKAGGNVEVNGNIKATGGLEPNYDSGWTSVALNSNYTFTHNFGQRARDVIIWVAQNSDGSGWSFIANGLIYDSTGSYTVWGVGIAQNNLNDIKVRAGEMLGFSHDGTNHAWRSSGYIKVLAWK